MSHNPDTCTCSTCRLIMTERPDNEPKSRDEFHRLDRASRTLIWFVRQINDAKFKGDAQLAIEAIDALTNSDIVMLMGMGVHLNLEAQRKRGAQPPPET